MIHPALKFLQTIKTTNAEYVIEFWGKSYSTEKNRTKENELTLLKTQHPHIHCGLLEQVHGNKVVELSYINFADNLGSGDALITCEPNMLCCIRSADCVPLLGFSQDKPLCFAIHAGWRGLHDNIIAATMKCAVEHYGVHPASLKIMIGPHILCDSYETGREVWSRFDARYSKTNGEKGFLDLTAIARDQLLSCGISFGNIMHEAHNTLGSDLFFSHRGGDSGRNLNVIYLKN